MEINDLDFHEYRQCNSRFLVLSSPPPISLSKKLYLGKVKMFQQHCNKGEKGKNFSIIVMFMAYFLSDLYLSKFVAYLNKYPSEFNFA